MGTTRNKIASFVEQKKEQVIYNIENSSATVFILKWAATHWVTILIVLIFSVLSVRSYLTNQSLYDELLKKQIQDLQEDKKKIAEEQAKLQQKIKDLENLKSTSKKETLNLRGSLKNKSLDEKKKILLDYKNRLLVKRSIK